MPLSIPHGADIYRYLLKSRWKLNIYFCLVGFKNDWYGEYKTETKDVGSLCEIKQECVTFS